MNWKHKLGFAKLYAKHVVKDLFDKFSDLVIDEAQTRARELGEKLDSKVKSANKTLDDLKRETGAKLKK